MLAPRYRLARTTPNGTAPNPGLETVMAVLRSRPYAASGYCVAALSATTLSSESCQLGRRSNGTRSSARHAAPVSPDRNPRAIGAEGQRSELTRAHQSCAKVPRQAPRTCAHDQLARRERLQRVWRLDPNRPHFERKRIRQRRLPGQAPPLPWLRHRQPRCWRVAGQAPRGPGSPAASRVRLLVCVFPGQPSTAG